MRHDSTIDFPAAGKQAALKGKAGFDAMLGAHDSYLRDMLASLGYAMSDLAQAQSGALVNEQAVLEACKACGSRVACRAWLDSRAADAFLDDRRGNTVPLPDAIPGFCANREVLTDLLADRRARKPARKRD
jgi:hypothetical protein